MSKPWTDNGRLVKLFIGIPTWNSEVFLPVCLSQIKKNTLGIPFKIVVLDNDSLDRTEEIARDYGCEFFVKKCGLPDALNRLLSLSSLEYTLLMHADTILLSEKWFELTSSRLRDNVALVSPQDIGCGPFTRPWGRGMPESSFLLFDTKKVKKARKVRWVRRFSMPFPQSIFDFYVEHVTHKLPRDLAEVGLTWGSMKVHTSRRLDHPIYTPPFNPCCWTEELRFLEYGLGNFYSLDGVITHYHNWYERVLRDVPDDSEVTADEQGGIPLAYISGRTRAFLSDLTNGSLNLPNVNDPEREPKAI